MASFGFLLKCALLLLCSACSYAEVVEHNFQVETITVERLCKKQNITVVNGQYPGPTVHVHEGDTLVVHVFNKSPYDISIHWHGIFQMFSAWADGAGYITQCPILPGNSYTYKFNITDQEGTLWWHAHISWLRATVHGALIIHPKVGRTYPFEKPYEEVPILLGDWWNNNIIDIADEYFKVDQLVSLPDAFTINGEPGDFYGCSSNSSTYKLTVKQGKTYLLRIIGVGLNNEVFFRISNHNMTVVAVDACYTNPYVTDVIVVAPGQTTDVLLKADQAPMSYYMAAHAYISFADHGQPFTAANVSSGVIIYEGTNSTSSLLPILPKLPDHYDNLASYNFNNNLTGLTTSPLWVPVPQVVDEHMFITVGMGFVPCHEIRHITCGGPLGQLLFGNMNNVSFKLPSKVSLLEASFNNIEGIYSTDFPDEPPLKFDYTNPINTYNKDLLWISGYATKVKKLKYNAIVEIVLQNTVLGGVEDHPMHLHGFNFHVLGQGFGNYDRTRYEKSLNIINPQQRNTIHVPTGGWAVIRFQANNPGFWFMHCHFETHMSTGLATAFLVENGPTHSTSLPPPPLDLPQCRDTKKSSGSREPTKVISLAKSFWWTSLV